MTEEESRTVAQQLDEAGLDLIELSGGSYESMAFEHKKESTKAREAFFIEFAEKVKPMLKNAVLCTTGGFRVSLAFWKASPIVFCKRLTRTSFFFSERFRHVEGCLGGRYYQCVNAAFPLAHFGVRH